MTIAQTPENDIFDQAAILADLRAKQQQPVVEPVVEPVADEPSSPPAVEPATPSVTNADFLRAVAQREGVPQWVCSFEASPSSDGARWGGRRHTSGAPLALPQTHNTYLSTAELKPDGTRKKDDFVRLQVLVGDDADRDSLKAPPSYILETSPGKVQIGYILADDAESRDRDLCDRAINAMVATGLVDKSGNNVARYVRLPQGVNTKYEGKPAHRMLEWHPERIYTLSEALAALGATQASPAPAAGAVEAVDAGADDTAGEWVDDGPGRLDVEKAQADIISGAVLHDSLIRLAGHYASKGMPADEIYAVLAGLMEQSAAKTTRPEDWKTRMAKLRDDTIASAVKKFGDSYATKVDFSDTGNRNLLAQKTGGDLRYVTESRIWIVWTGHRWEVDKTDARAAAAAALVAEHYAQEVVRLTAQLRGMDSALAKRHQKTIDSVAAWEKTCRNRRGIENMLALAKLNADFILSEAQLDTNPHLLGVQNGVVDLKTGELRPDAREDFVTRRCAHAYKPDAKAPRWSKFIEEVTGYPIEALRDAETGEVIAGTVGRYTQRPAFANYVQRALGYSITGLTVEHKLFTLTGEHGSNGKNVLFDTVRHVLGSYAVKASEKLLLSSRKDTDANSATPALVALKGSRLAVSSEPPANSTFDAAMLKSLTGEVKVAGRGLHANADEIAVTWKLWLLCNAKPKVQHLEQAVVSRILMLPFDRQWNRAGVAEHDPMLPEPDKHLLAALRDTEGEGVLAWLVAGARAYVAEGLEPCQEVVAATRAYFDDQRVDPVGKWLGEQELCAPAVGTQASVLFKAFTAWRAEHEAEGDLRAGDSPVTAVTFAAALKKAGVEWKTVNTGKRYGIRLADDFDAEPDQAAKDEYARLVATFGDLA